MHIQDFHSKLTSVSEESHLLAALRSLSQIDDPREVLSDGFSSEWPTWPALDAHAPSSASAGV